MTDYVYRTDFIQNKSHQSSSGIRVCCFRHTQEGETFLCVCVYSDGRAFAVGGMGPDLLPRSVLQQYDLRKDVWALLPPMPTPRYDASICLQGSKIYVAGCMCLSVYVCV